MGARSLRQQVTRMFMVGFPGTSLDDGGENRAALEGLRALIRDGLFGAILFRRNIESPEQTARLCTQLKAEAGRPFILSVDQEGGRVARMRGGPFTSLPPMREIGERGDEALAERVGRLLAYELRAVGFDWDFAPVLDVDTNAANPVIGDRSFHRDAEVVARLGVALARGMEAGGMASCGKHFPGHGDTSQDSHLTLPRLPHGLERLRKVELVPFVAYARAKLASLMTAHVVFEAVDPDVPATLSPRVMDGMLRRELGFDGVMVSDDLEMKAIADHYGVGEAAVLGTLAGVDLFLVCHRIDRQRDAIDSVIRAVEEGRIPRERIEEANRRLDALASRFGSAGPAGLHTLGTPEHLALRDGLTASFAGTDPTEALT